MKRAGRPFPFRIPFAVLPFLVFSLTVVSQAAAIGEGEVSPFTIRTATNQSLGTYLVDSRGHALYYSTNDLPGISNCSGGCEAVWLPFTAVSIKVPSILSKADFGYITRNKGLRQVTYKGWPLYTYARDWGPQDTNGQGLYDSWFVVQLALFGPSKR